MELRSTSTFRTSLFRRGGISRLLLLHRWLSVPSPGSSTNGGGLHRQSPLFSPGVLAPPAAGEEAPPGCGNSFPASSAGLFHLPNDVGQDVAGGEPAKGPFHQRRRAKGRDECHDDEGGVDVQRNDARREADLREEELHHPSRVESEAEGHQGTAAEAREESAEDPAEELPEERHRDDEDDDGPCP